MKALLIAALIATAALTPGIAARAASAVSAPNLLQQALVERRSHRCDTPAQIAANSICWKP
jgi:hypothetical protein